MNLPLILVCFLQGLLEFTDAQCSLSSQNFFCEGVDNEGFLHEYYEHFRKPYMYPVDFIKISGGNWTNIDYFPTPSINGEYHFISSLAINYASIQQIDKHAFEDLWYLTSLDLSHNQLETTLFINYLPQHLQTLNLASNKIAHVASFTRFQFLSYLDMSNNRIRCLDFGNFSEITVLDFSGNKIDSLLGSDSYYGEVASMNLSGNKITEFEEYDQVFHSLDLSFNNLSVVQLVHEKRFLNLSNCNISNFVYDYLECVEVDFSQFQFNTTPGSQIYVTGKLKIQVGKNTHLMDITSDIRNMVSEAVIIDLSYSSITNIPAEAFHDFHVRSLILSNMNVSELNSFSFKFTNLDVLELSHSNIKVLQPNVFNGLTSDVINLSFNRIFDIKRVFYEVSARKIDLSFNALKSIGNNSFENCNILSEIILSNCLIDKIEPLAFIRLQMLRILDLSNNKLHMLERNTFHDLPLMELRLGKNKITTIRSRAFSDLPRLRSLNLSSVHLHNLEMNAFVNLSQIESIDLSHNHINITPHQLFVDTPRLKIIDLTYNNISTFMRFSNKLKITNISLSINGSLTSDKLSNLNIRYFALENSRIENLEADSFQGMYNLEELHFTNSDIRFLESGTLNGLYNLYYLDSQNLFMNIEHIEKETFRDLRSLRTLNLSGLSIQIIEPNSFRGLSNIQELILSKNSLGRLNEDTFAGLHTLKVLDLSFNYIVEIDKGVLNPLRNLEELYLQHNGVSNLEPYHFIYLNALKKLRLDHNNITYLAPDSFSGLQNLQELHLGSNNLTGWAVGVFQHLSNLSVLNLSHNELKTIETGIFSNLVSLAILDLTETSLNKLDEVGVFFSLIKLKHLFLDGTNLYSFDFERLIKNIRNIVYIGISHNKWQCKELLMIIELFNNRKISYEPKIPVYDSYNINGVGCIDF